MTEATKQHLHDMVIEGTLLADDTIGAEVAARAFMEKQQ
jgi:hypothetical protein